MVPAMITFAAVVTVTAPETATVAPAVTVRPHGKEKVPAVHDADDEMTVGTHWEISEAIALVVALAVGDGTAVASTQPAACGAHVATLEPAPLTLEKGVLATTLPAASSSWSVKPKPAPRVKPSTATLVTTALAAKVTCREGDGSHGQ